MIRSCVATTQYSNMCGDMGKAVLRALTGALLCGLVSDAAYLQVSVYSPYTILHFYYKELTVEGF